MTDIAVILAAVAEFALFKLFFGQSRVLVFIINIMKITEIDIFNIPVIQADRSSVG